MNAFPSGTMDNYGVHITEAIHEGMALRDYFAAKAMAALVVVYKDDHAILDDYAERAYHIADAMLKAR